jgi:hypothetical protein
MECMRGMALMPSWQLSSNVSNVGPYLGQIGAQVSDPNDRFDGVVYAVRQALWNPNAGSFAPANTASKSLRIVSGAPLRAEDLHHSRGRDPPPGGFWPSEPRSFDIIDA